MVIPWSSSSTGLAIAAAAITASTEIPWNFITPKAELAFAGLVGGLISLAITKQPTVTERIICLLAGGAAGFYFAPLTVAYFKANGEFSTGVALILGLVAMPVFMGIHKLSEMFAKNPLSLLKKFKIVKEEDRKND